MAAVQPLDLTKEEKDNIVNYIKTFNDFMGYNYEDDPFDPMKRTEYMCLCGSMKDQMKNLYSKIPQIVKDEKLVPKPEHPYY